jgi:hypothetical protein
MPWRLIGFIVLFGIFLVFITLNLHNGCDISFGFTTVESVPVYLTAFCAFALGLLGAIPLSLSFRRKKKNPGTKQPETPVVLGGGKSKKTWGKKDAPLTQDDIPEVSPYREDDGSYGID